MSHAIDSLLILCTIPIVVLALSYVLGGLYDAARRLLKQ